MNKILEHLNNGTLLRGAWGDGRETACLYSALVPAATSSKNCPADVMPQWLADVTPDLDDCISEDGWEDRVRRFGYASVRWSVLSDNQWEFIRRQWTADCIELAREYASELDHGDYWPDAESVSTSVVETLRINQDPSEEQIEAAEEAAARAAEAAAGPLWLVGAAEAAAGVVWAAGAVRAAEAAAWDRLFDMLLGRIEAECHKSEIQ